MPKTIEHATEVLRELKSKHSESNIRRHEILPMRDTNTRKDIGFSVIIDLNNWCEYMDDFFNGWKTRFEADDYSINAKGGRLQVKFNVRYNS